MDDYATVFKSLSDPTRLRILRLLLEAGTPLCVCELVDSLEEPQYNVSKHVASLKAARLLETHKDGRWVYCQPAVAEEFLSLVQKAVAAIPAKREAQIRRDRAELQKRLKLRQGDRCLLGIQKRNLGLVARKGSP